MSGNPVGFSKVVVQNDDNQSISKSKGIYFMNIETGIQDTKVKMQYILNVNGELCEIEKDKCNPVDFPIKYKLKNAFEVFVRVAGTENYWISNYGRCVNNLNHKDKNTFFEHKQGKCHYTVFGIDRIEKPIKYRGKLTGRVKIIENRFKIETSPEKLVADTFLIKYEGRRRIWHKDGDESNNWYKNLLMVSEQDYKDLKAGKITWQELNLEQEYIEYENKASQTAYKIYNGIVKRCSDTTDDDNVRSCYGMSTMWQGWIDDPKSFVIWYLNNYYEVDDEEMDVDKDLFGDGSGMYHPDFCCILPKGLNTLLANSKKHYKKGETSENTLPLGVRLSEKTKKYYGEITFTGDEPLQLSEWDTPEEAFAEYKLMKLSDIYRVAAKYKRKVPKKIYDALLKVDVKPY